MPPSFANDLHISTTNNKVEFDGSSSRMFNLARILNGETDSRSRQIISRLLKSKKIDILDSRNYLSVTAIDSSFVDTG